MRQDSASTAQAPAAARARAVVRRLLQAWPRLRRRRLRSAMREAEARFRELLELSSDWYWETDRAHRFTYISSGVKRALDLDSDFALGKTRWELDYLNMSEGDWAAHRARLESREPFEQLYLCRRNRAGRVVHQLVSGRPSLDAAGGFAGYRGIGHDISAEVEYREALRAQGDRLARVIETMAEGLVILDVEGRYVLINAAAERLAGVPRNEVYGLRVAEVPWRRQAVDGRTEAMPAQALERLARGERLIAGESYAIERRDGRRIVLRSNATRLEDARGRFDGAIITLEDVTERRAAEARLAESEMRFRRLFELAQDGIAIHSAGVCEQANAAMQRLLGAPSVESLVGTRLVDWIAPEFHDSVRERLATLASGPVQVPYLERRLRRHDGSELEVEMAGASFREGDAIRAHIVVRDVSARKALEDELRRLNADLEARVALRTAEITDAYRELETFSYGISHDLRAPLRAITGFSQLLVEEHRAQLAPEAAKLLERMRAGAARMSAIIDALLAFSRLTRAALRRVRVDPRELVREVIDDLAPALHGRRIEFSIGELPVCDADRTLLRQVFANLVGNAVKYSARRERARIEIGALRGGARPTYYVRDNGAGFDMRYAEKLFAPFQRVHAASEFEGTGIGLAIAQRIVARHGGRIWADAAPERGACFCFQLGD